jgi:RNA polymerase sigma-70 factor (ECF subfamily)
LSPSEDFDYEAALFACAQGDRQALARIYERESRHLLGVALRIVRQRQTAEDVVHDAFVSIWKRAMTFDATRGAGRGWIYSVVRHSALNWVRDHARDVHVDDESAMALQDGMALAAHDERADAGEVRVGLGRLDGCLDQLDIQRRECIVLAYVDGCSHGEIARRTGNPLGTVKAWIQRSMRSLRECMA